jgi:hypothetical protein
MKNLILATIISSSLLIADNGVALPEYDLVKKDFINGEINNERLSQIILKDPRLVPKSRGGLKDDVDANSDGLGVLVIGKILNGSVDSIELQNDNRNVNNKLNYLIKKYGDDAKSAGMSTIDYVKNAVQTGVLSGDEAETIKSKLSRNDIVSLSMSSSNTSPKISDIITISTTIVGNDDDSNINYNWTSSENVNIESDNGDNIIVSFNKPGPFTIEITANDIDNSKSTNLSSTVVANSISTLKDAYNDTLLKSQGYVYVSELDNTLIWDGTYWRDNENSVNRYEQLISSEFPLVFSRNYSVSGSNPAVTEFNTLISPWQMSCYFPLVSSLGHSLGDGAFACSFHNYSQGKTHQVSVLSPNYIEPANHFCKVLAENNEYVAKEVYRASRRNGKTTYAFDCVIENPKSCTELGLPEIDGKCLQLLPQ